MSDEASSGFGQLDPSDTASAYNVACFQISQLMKLMNTMTPVKVMAVNATGGLALAGTVDVQPLVSMIDGNNNVTPHGTVNGLTYFRMQGGKNAIILDPVVGDIGFAVFADHDISAVVSSKAAAPPGSQRRFDWADGIYVGGILNDVPDQYVLMSDSGISIVDNQGNTIVSSSGGLEITPKSGQPVTIDGKGDVTGELDVGGNLVVSGSTRIAGGATITRVLSASHSTNFGGLIPSGSVVGLAVSVPGARVGDIVVVTPDQGTNIIRVYGVVSTDTVTLVAANSFSTNIPITIVGYSILVIGTT